MPMRCPRPLTCCWLTRIPVAPRGSAAISAWSAWLWDARPIDLPKPNAFGAIGLTATSCASRVPAFAATIDDASAKKVAAFPRATVWVVSVARVICTGAADES